MRSAEHRIKIREVFCFGLVGVSATLTHYLVALACHEGLTVNLYIANLIGYLCAMSVSYVGHGRLTFRVQLSRATLKRFAVASITTFTLAELLLLLLEQSSPLPHRISLSLVVLSVPILSFLLNKFWVYHQKGDGEYFY